MLDYWADSYLCANVRVCALSLFNLGIDCLHVMIGERLLQKENRMEGYDGRIVGLLLVPLIAVTRF